MLVDISSRRTQLQDGTQLRERQTEIKKGQGPQCPALCYLLSPGESQAGSQAPLALAYCEKSRWNVQN